jgi:hypothetical protein
VAGTTTDPGSLQQHEAAQKQPTHPGHQEGLRLHKTLTFWFQYTYTDCTQTHPLHSQITGLCDKFRFVILALEFGTSFTFPPTQFPPFSHFILAILWLHCKCGSTSDPHVTSRDVTVTPALLRDSAVMSSWRQGLSKNSMSKLFS